MGRGFRVTSFMSELNKSFHSRTSLIIFFQMFPRATFIFSKARQSTYSKFSHFGEMPLPEASIMAYKEKLTVFKMHRVKY